MLYYTYTQNRVILEDNERIENLKFLERKTEAIARDLGYIKNELRFMSSLKVMDDILSEDIDKRIRSLLEKRKSVLPFEVDFMLFNVKSLLLDTDVKAVPSISFSQEIYSSFDQRFFLGRLGVHWYTSNFKNYFSKDDVVKIEIQNQEVYVQNSKKHLGKRVSKRFFGSYSLSKFSDDALMKKSLDTLEYQLSIMAVFGTLVLIFIAFFVSRLMAQSFKRLSALQEEKITYQKRELLLLEKSTHAYKTQSRFISAMSHDFRTPLNSIIGFSQFIDQEKLLDVEYENLPKNIERAGKQMLTLTNQILEFAKAESVKSELNIEGIDIQALCEELSALHSGALDKKNLVFISHLVPCLLESDRAKISSIITNLLANAIKYTQEGTVSLILSEDALRVKDSGVGIDKEMREYVFEPFVRINPSKKLEGSGLGLSLSRSYAQELGMKLYIEESANGSSFVLEFVK